MLPIAIRILYTIHEKYHEIAKYFYSNSMKVDGYNLETSIYYENDVKHQKLFHNDRENFVK